jgi:hypothetical protein
MAMLAYCVANPIAQKKHRNIQNKSQQTNKQAMGSYWFKKHKN